VLFFATPPLATAAWALAAGNFVDSALGSRLDNLVQKAACKEVVRLCFP